MNEIILKGQIRNIEYSHTIGEVDYNKADLIVTRKDGKEDVISLRFKALSNPYKENQIITLQGNIRSYSKKISENKNKVSIYVFTYFDLPTYDSDEEIIDKVLIRGRVCKIDDLRKTASGRKNLHIILANNIINQDNTYKLNNYIPMVFWGKLAKEATSLNINDVVEIEGQLHSRNYTKKNPTTNEFEIKVAHEVVVSDFRMVSECE